jgi:predicted alpha/beta-hydrolase family hydrolase
MSKQRSITIQSPALPQLSGLLYVPPNPTMLFVMAHGAGAGMRHSFMESVATGLNSRGIAVLRYQFPYMESGMRRPDRPAVAHAAIRAAVDEAARLFPGTPLIAGGKSFGARMTTEAHANQALPGVVGLAAFGFPLHMAGKPSDHRAAHLAGVALPILFLQGDRDALADLGLLRDVISRLGRVATLHVLHGADHSFQVTAKSGRTSQDIMDEALDVFLAWTQRLANRTICQ